VNTIVYDIPIHLVPAYNGRRVIVRSENPAAIVEALAENDLQTLMGVRLLSLTADLDPLANWGYAVPVELKMTQPETEFPLLYRHAKLLDKHPVRVLIPAVVGLNKAVKVATSLQFTVKLEITRPGAAAVEEMRTALDFYLHHSSVTQPVEFFHGALSAFYRNDRVTLWDIQEENPSLLRFVTDDGAESIARRDSVDHVTDDLDNYMATFKEELLTERGECYGCEFFENCVGYFRWQHSDYTCEGVRPLLRTLQAAAVELRRDLDMYANSKVEAVR
jgi:hypothetical protein